MEYFKTQENHTRIDVYFDGEKYVFINAFHGIVAVARRQGLVDFSQDGYMSHASFEVEKSSSYFSLSQVLYLSSPEYKLI